MSKKGSFFAPSNAVNSNGRSMAVVLSVMYYIDI